METAKVMFKGYINGIGHQQGNTPLEVLTKVREYYSKTPSELTEDVIVDDLPF